MLILTFLNIKPLWSVAVDWLGAILSLCKVNGGVGESLKSAPYRGRYLGCSYNWIDGKRGGVSCLAQFFWIYVNTRIVLWCGIKQLSQDWRGGLGSVSSRALERFVCSENAAKGHSSIWTIWSRTFLCISVFAQHRFCPICGKHIVVWGILPPHCNKVNPRRMLLSSLSSLSWRCATNANREEHTWGSGVREFGKRCKSTTTQCEHKTTPREYANWFGANHP